MREDMDKVVGDKSRRGRKVKTQKGENRKKTWEETHEIESKTEPVRDKWGSRRYYGRSKPLYNFLKSKIGCKWDDVYSEICAQMSKDSIAQKWVRDQVFNFVYVHCFEYNGQVYDAKGLPISGGRVWHTLYVLDGILYKVPDREKKYRRPKAKFQAGICPLLYNGIWYEVTLREVRSKYRAAMPKDGLRDKFLGFVTEQSVLNNFYGTDYSNTVYCTEKRQMNKREIRRIANA
jgi:hypothetical protein